MSPKFLYIDLPLGNMENINLLILTHITVFRAHSCRPYNVRARKYEAEDVNGSNNLTTFLKLGLEIACCLHMHLRQ